MTVTTIDNTTQYVGDGVETVFSFSFQALDPSHMFALLDGIVEHDTTTVLNPDQENNAGGTVTFLVAPPNGSLITLVRLVPPDQQTDYREYDAFPALAHETALDKLTMLDQQNAERVLSALRFPIGDNAETIIPPVSVRAEGFLYFDPQGNVAINHIEDSDWALLSISIADDSTSILRIDASDAQRPKIGGNNINQPNGILQLNSLGKVPFANIGVGGISILGPYRGDDLCDKSGDGAGECIVPDSRNPSQRFPDRVPTYHGEPNTFATGDMFLLTFQEPEVEGTMLLFAERGTVENVIQVRPRDAIIFSSGWNVDGEPTPDFPQGWYHVPKVYDVGDANSITYTVDGNFIIQPSSNNVQLALDALDQNAVDIGDRNQTIDGVKTFVVPPRTAVEPTDDSDVARKAYVDGLVSDSIQAMLQALYPVGSYKIGIDPTSIVGGTWEQLGEGTFLMNTVGGADDAGGANSLSLVQANMVAHTHPFAGTALPVHRHGSGHVQPASYGTTNYMAYGGKSVSPTGLGGSPIAPGNTPWTENISGGTPAGNVNANTGQTGAAFNNRPLYEGVQIWKRTA